MTPERGEASAYGSGVVQTLGQPRFPSSGVKMPLFVLATHSGGVPVVPGEDFGWGEKHKNTG